MILGGVVDGIIPLNAESSALLQDSLHILSSKEIKLTSLRVKQNEDVVADEQEMAAVVIAAAKKNIITQVVKKNVIENIVPIVMSLKHMLEKHRSPVLKDLMYYLRELMKDYKTEVKDILAADRQLASEIEFDLRKFEEQQEEAARRKSMAQNSPTIQSIQASPAVGSTKGTPAGTSSPSNQNKSPSANKDTPLHGSHIPQPVMRSPGSVGSSGQSPLGSSPGSRQQHRTQSPLKNPPVMSLLNEHRATPRREAPLSTIALLNSAKKLISKVQQMDTSKLNSPSGKKSENNRRKSCLSKGDKADSDSETSTVGVRFAVDEEASESEDNTPLRPNTRSSRAISTPSAVTESGVLGNITFHMDQNVTLIPPSPIPTSLPIRVYADMSDEGESPVTPRKRNNKQTDKEVVYMFSPDKPSPKPRKWNVKSAPPTRSEIGKGTENIESDSEESQFLSLSEQGNENSDIPKRDNRKTAVPDKNQDKPVVRRSSGRRNVRSRKK